MLFSKMKNSYSSFCTKYVSKGGLLWWEIIWLWHLNGDYETVLSYLENSVLLTPIFWVKYITKNFHLTNDFWFWTASGRIKILCFWIRIQCRETSLGLALLCKINKWTFESIYFIQEGFRFVIQISFNNDDLWFGSYKTSFFQISNLFLP